MRRSSSSFSPRKAIFSVSLLTGLLVLAAPAAPGLAQGLAAPRVPRKGVEEKAIRDVMEPVVSPGFIRGDANADGRVDISDPVVTLRALFQGGALPRCPAAADANDDEFLDVSDPIATLLALFQGLELPAPWPESGEDPTPGLGCPPAEVDEPAPEPTEGQDDEGQGFPSPDSESYVRLVLRVTPDGLVVDRARVIAGPLVAPEEIGGEQVWEVCDAAGNCLAAGGTSDPSEIRGTRGPNGDGGVDDHYHGQSSDGELVVRFSGRDLDEDRLKGIQVRLYRRGTATESLARLKTAEIPSLRRGGLVLEAATSTAEVARIVAPVLAEFDRGGIDDLTSPRNPFADSAAVPLLVNGPTGTKKNLVILGDGFTLGDQDEFNELVDEKIMEGVFGHDVFAETASAFNIFRLNLISADSGVTQATFTQWESIEVAYPEAAVLFPGVATIVLPGGQGVALPVFGTGTACSLDMVRVALESLSWQGVDECGNTATYQFNVRMITRTGDLDGDGDDEPIGKLWVGAPAGLPGLDGDFSIQWQIVPPPGPIGHANYPLSFHKTHTGTLVERDTALRYIYSGSWDYCWLQSSCDTGTLRNLALSLVPDWDYAVIVLNESGTGGCGGDGIQTFTKDVSWQVIAHEFGHGIGGLSDEYVKSRRYTGDRPKGPNLDNTTDRNKIKWRDFIRPSTNLPTVDGPLIHGNQDCGAFEGGGSYSEDIFRPVANCRMNGNTPEFCPVCYTQIRELLFPYQGVHFVNAYTGDFNGDGKDDLVQHAGTMLALHLSDGSKLVPTWIATEEIPTGGWRIRARDRYYVADQNGDGRDDLFVFNGEDWNKGYLGVLRSTGDGFVRTARYDGQMPNWKFRYRDNFYAGDFDSDGREDLYVTNSKDWGPEYLGLLRSSGGGLQLVRRYDDAAPGWEMANFDVWHAGDFNGDGRADLCVRNTLDWNSRWAGILRSTGNALSPVKVWADSLAGWEMGEHDTYYVGDFDADGRDDLYVFNGHDWPHDYLGMFRSTNNGLSFIRLYTDELPGWNLERWDTFKVADVNGDGRADLYVYNEFDWGEHVYVGTLRSTGSALQGSWLEDAIGKWALERQQWLLPADFSGDGRDDLFIRSAYWFGLFRSTGTSLDFLRRYFHWIHNFRFHGPLGHDVQAGGFQQN